VFGIKCFSVKGSKIVGRKVLKWLQTLLQELERIDTIRLKEFPKGDITIGIRQIYNGKNQNLVGVGTFVALK
jgi:hypothetical protein